MQDCILVSRGVLSKIWWKREDFPTIVRSLSISGNIAPDFLLQQFFDLNGNFDRVPNLLFEKPDVARCYWSRSLMKLISNFL